MSQKENEWEEKLLDLIDDQEAGYMDFAKLIREILSTREKEIAETLNSRYGKDGLPSLVIIESHEGGTMQRPALEDILSIILKKTL